MPADLHIHSKASDGSNTPEEIVELAAAAGLTTIALTDHDNIDGIAAAQDRGRTMGVEVIPGIEFTTNYHKGAHEEVHILGYFIDYQNQELLSALKVIQDDRVRRIYKIVKKLKSLKIEIEPEEVFALAGKKAPGRPHVARVLMQKGVVASFKEAFNRFLDARSPAYVGHYKLSPKEVIELIRRVGGIAVFGHPAVSRCDEVIPELVADGLRGLEVYYGGASAETVEHYRVLAKEQNLLATGGSDYHGPDASREVKLGEVKLADEFVMELKNEHLRGNKS